MSIALQTRVQALEARVEELVKKQIDTNAVLVQIFDRLKALEQKRGPGRPPKNG